MEGGLLGYLHADLENHGMYVSIAMNLIRLINLTHKHSHAGTTQVHYSTPVWFIVVMLVLHLWQGDDVLFTPVHVYQVLLV